MDAIEIVIYAVYGVTYLTKTIDNKLLISKIKFPI